MLKHYESVPKFGKIGVSFYVGDVYSNTFYNYYFSSTIEQSLFIYDAVTFKRSSTKGSVICYELQRRKF
jgi:hypothetical protein